MSEQPQKSDFPFRFAAGMGAGLAVTGIGIAAALFVLPVLSFATKSDTGWQVYAPDQSVSPLLAASLALLLVADSFVPALILATALHLLLGATRQTSVWSYLLFGVLVFGLSPIVGAGLGALYSGEGGPVAMGLLPVTCIAGVLGGLVFWLVRRPDRDRTGKSAGGTP